MTAQFRRSTRSLSRGAAAVIVAVLAAGGLALAMPAAQADGDTIGIAGGPSGADGPDQRTRLSYQVAPGQTVTDHYVVRNTGSTPQDVRVFATDAYNTADGAFALLDTDAKPVDAGAWVTVDGKPQVDVTLAPTEQKILEFTLVVPADASPGDHAAGMVVSAAGVDGQVRVDRRVATRLYVRVAGPLQPNLTLSSITADQALNWNPFTGTTDVTVTVHNTGNVALGADVTAKVSTWFGLGAGQTLRDQVDELLPGATREVTFHVTGVGRVGYLAPEVRLQPTIAPDAMDPGPLRPVARDTTLVSVPWLALVLLALTAAFVLLVRLRRRRADRLAAQWVAYTRAEAQRDAQSSSMPETPVRS